MVTMCAQSGFSKRPYVVREPRADERKIIGAAQKGDVRSFNRLVCAYQGVVYHTAFRVLGDPDAAADATQDALISAFKHLRSFRGGSFEAWLLRIVTNACYDQLRARQRKPTVSLEALTVEGDTPAMPASTSRAPEEFVEQRDLSEVIQKGLQALATDQRLTVTLADVDGFSYEEIAWITNTNIGTVKSRLSRGRGLLRDFLIGQGEFPGTRGAASSCSASTASSRTISAAG
jgi:RNA polymerase sigma-70 factor (ECF subfamily)